MANRETIEAENTPTQQPPSPAPSGGADKQAQLDAFRTARDKHQDLKGWDFER